ncbi:hypothetical protein NLI96_g11223 [Meripilus lineatus]|uniref:Exonuclease domain-containing protein n=1 Tax=Meripilus lineatus TaxID=2056292 RepID=A0AAD5UWD5_9APHY|nr:hypothetical protein NLI96_g11223 [Physisporinus lineatus]
MSVPFPWLPNALYLVFPIVFLVLLVCGRHCFSPQEHSFQALNDSKSSILPDTPPPVSPSSSSASSSSNTEPTESPLPSPEMQKQKVDAYIDRTLVKQTYDAFLVLDVEATCVQGADFNYPNEIIASIPPSLFSGLGKLIRRLVGVASRLVEMERQRLFWKGKQTRSHRRV